MASEKKKSADFGTGEASKAKSFGIAVLNLLATVHVVWFYLIGMRSYMKLARYEQGVDKTPFQHRLLMMYPLRWAHQSSLVNAAAHWLSGMSAWFPNGVRPEGLIEGPIDVICVVIAGMTARSLYRASSKRQLLTPFVYPLTLLMVMATYSLYTMHRLRFVYDLPSLAFFSIGLSLIYFRRSSLLFAVLFVVATINRETTLFLLPLYALAHAVKHDRLEETAASLSWSRMLNLRTLLVVTPLAAYWAVWHVWVAHHFASNVSEGWPRSWLNVGILLWPTSWAQIASTFAFCGPLVLLNRKLIHDRTLRAWQWVLPVWLVFMFRFGILIETRIFGELIPYMACMAVLITEEKISERLGRISRAASRTEPPKPSEENDAGLAQLPRIVVIAS